MSSFVDAAGKEAPLRRARSRLMIDFAIEFFRALVRRLDGNLPPDHPELASLAEQAIKNGWIETAAIAAIERSLEALSHIDRNVNQATMIESWLDDLAALAAQSGGCEGLP